MIEENHLHSFGLQFSRIQTFYEAPWWQQIWSCSRRHDRGYDVIDSWRLLSFAAPSLDHCVRVCHLH